MSDTQTPKKLICVPGSRLCYIKDNILGGDGTYEMQGYLHSTLAGVVRIRKRGKYTYVDVVSEASKKTILPMVGDVVTARITIVAKRFAKCEIIAVKDVVLYSPFRAQIRKEDARIAAADVEMHKNFRPGDVILAKILPQNDLRFFPLTTAENELGVVFAVARDCVEKVPMVPISWNEMQCPMTLIKEPRKVAKIVPELFETIKD